MKKILTYGSGHRADSWNKVISYMKNDKDILCPNLLVIINGKEASYTNLYSSFAEYCNKIADSHTDAILVLNFDKMVILKI